MIYFKILDFTDTFFLSTRYPAGHSSTGFTVGTGCHAQSPYKVKIRKDRRDGISTEYLSSLLAFSAAPHIPVNNSTPRCDFKAVKHTITSPPNVETPFLLSRHDIYKKAGSVLMRNPANDLLGDIRCRID